MNKLPVITLLLTSLTNIPAISSDNEYILQHNVLGVFLGMSKSPQKTQNSYGLEYEYRLNEVWGLGVTYKETPDSRNDHQGFHDDVSVYLASAYWHHDALRLGLGLGKEKVHGSQNKSENLIRVGLGYDFHITGCLSAAPTFHVDQIDGDYTKVYGVTFNYSF